MSKVSEDLKYIYCGNGAFSSKYETKEDLIYDIEQNCEDILMERMIENEEFMIVLCQGDLEKVQELRFQIIDDIVEYCISNGCEIGY